MHMVVWVQRGNMHSIPTDCPQRNERAGWMGDIQSFGQTAIFNMDMAGFFTKWVPDVRDSQAEDGRYPNFAPMYKDTWSGGTPAWADAGTVVPWRVYQNYADTRMLEEHFESARRWVDFVHSKNPNLVWEKELGNKYNDWLNADTIIMEGWPKTGGAVPPQVLATAFFAHSTEIVAKMAAIIGRKAEAQKYEQMFEGIKAAFNEKYVTPDGRIEGDTQAGYALALRFNLLPDELRLKAAKHMVDGFKRYDGHMSTGIQTTHRLMLELTRNGYNDEAYRLLNLRTFPSWGFMLDQGATTIWERWDGYVKGRGFQNAGMNSFNHWALGSVGEWMWRHIVGINPDEAHPAYKHFVIRPRPGGGLTWAKGTYKSIRGLIASDWKIANDEFTLNVTIPANTAATVYVPTTDPKSVTEGGKPVGQARGVEFLRVEECNAVFTVESGRYVFTSKLK
jgi:alpha-L-rhamnosidase